MLPCEFELRACFRSCVFSRECRVFVFGLSSAGAGARGGNYVKMLRRCLIKCSFESKCFLLLIIDDDGDLLLLPILKLICFAAYFATSFQN